MDSMQISFFAFDFKFLNSNRDFYRVINDLGMILPYVYDTPTGGVGSVMNSCVTVPCGIQEIAAGRPVSPQSLASAQHFSPKLNFAKGQYSAIKDPSPRETTTTMSLRATALRTASSIQDRTLYLRVKPAPSTLSERRAVLHALKQYGQIDVFKKLYDDSSFISVPNKLATFWKIRKMSPIQFDYQDENNSEVVADPRVALPFKVPSSATGATAATIRHTFTVEAFPAHDYPHKAAIERSPLYGPWPPQTEKSLVTSALMQVVPKDMASRGLADWETGAQLEQDPDARIAWLTSQNNSAQQRIARRNHKKVLSELANIVGSRDRNNPGR